MTISLLGTTRPYSLSSWQKAVTVFSLSGLAFAGQHFQLAHQRALSLEVKAAHIFVACIELIPVIGIVAAMIESVVAPLLHPYLALFLNTESPLERAIEKSDMRAVTMLIASGYTYSQYHPIFKAIEVGNLAMVKLFQEIDEDIRNESCDTPLLYAIRLGKKEIVHWLLAHCKDLNKKGKGGQTPLHIAISGKHLDVAQWLLDKGASIDIKTSIEGTPLHYAAAHGDLETVQWLVERGADKDATMPRCKSTPLLLALKKKKSDMVTYLLNKKPNIHLADREGRTLLHMAIENGDLELAKTLKEMGADINAVDHANRSCLHYALQNGKQEIAKWLLSLNPEVKIQDENGNTPLHLAASFGDLELVKQLLVLGADVNALDPSKNSPLHLALIHRKLDIAKELVEVETADWLVGPSYNIHLQNEEGNTPFHLAALYGDLEIAQILKSKAVNISALNKNRDTPLHLALMNKQRDLALWLLDQNPDLDAINGKGETILHTAAYAGYFDIVKRLHAGGARLDVKTSSWQSVLHYAAKSGNLELVTWLIDNGMDIRIKDKQGRTPIYMAMISGNLAIAKKLLHDEFIESIKKKEGKTTAFHDAARCCNLDVIKWLVDLGADLHVDENTGMTLLHYASLGDEIEVVSWLIEKGIDVNAVDKEGNTALVYATFRGNLSLIEKLHAAGANIDRIGPMKAAPLEVAILFKHLHIVTWLLSHKVRIDNEDEFGYSVLYKAVYSQNLDILQKLKEAGADLNVKGKNGKSLLRFVFSDKYREVAEWLFENGATFHPQDGVTVDSTLPIAVPKLVNAILDKERNASLTLKKRIKAIFYGIREKLWPGHILSFNGDPILDVLISLKSIVHVCSNYAALSLSPGNAFSLEGSSVHYFLREWAEHLRSSDIAKTLQPKQLNALIQAFYNGTQADYLEKHLLTNIIEKKLTIVPVGYHRHAACLIFHENTMILCDRLGSFQTVMAFKISPENVTKDIVKKILSYSMHRYQFSHRDYCRYFCGTLPQLLSPTGRIERDNQYDYLKTKRQKIGNCSYASSKAALRVALACVRAPDPILISKHLSIEMAEKERSHWESLKKDYAFEETKSVKAFFRKVDDKIARKKRKLALRSIH